MTYDIEMNAAFYRGYLADDRSLARHVVALATIVALWLLVYVAGSLAPLARQPMGPAQGSAPVAAQRAP